MTKLAITADPSFLISVTVYEDFSHEKAIGSASPAMNTDQPWTICCYNWKNSLKYQKRFAAFSEKTLFFSSLDTKSNTKTKLTDDQ
jgi:hypothetical protein